MKTLTTCNIKINTQNIIAFHKATAEEKMEMAEWLAVFNAPYGQPRANARQVFKKMNEICRDIFGTSAD